MTARDVYEEGALIFPSVRIQRDYTDVADIVRMCRARIRLPDQWYGDYVATLGAARIGERRMHELIARHGVETLERFVEEWFDYSERRARAAIGALGPCTLHGSTVHDPFPGTDDAGVTLRASITVQPQEGTLAVDLTDNPDNQPNGLNLTRATATAAALTGVLSALPDDIPSNAGAFRCFEVLLREGCVVGVPTFPHSCSSGTTNFADRVVGLVQAAFADLDGDVGLAEGATGQAPAKGVIAGSDERSGRGYINQILLGGTGGPASPFADGWPTFQRPVAGALIHHDSVEIDEQRYPILVAERRLVRDSGGAGRFRGGQGTSVVFGPRFRSTTITYGLDGRLNPPRGVRGGRAGASARARIEQVGSGVAVDAPAVGRLELAPGERIVSISAGGGGYGDPCERDPDAVLEDVLEGRVSVGAAFVLYGVVVHDGVLSKRATADERARRRRRR